MRRVTVGDIVRLLKQTGRTATSSLGRCFGRPKRRRVAGLSAALLWRCGAALAGVGSAAALVTAASSAFTAAPAVAVTDPAADARPPVRDVLQTALLSRGGPAEWVRLTRPLTKYHLEAPDFDQQPLIVEALRSADGGRRRDGLQVGGFAVDRPHLVLGMHRDMAGGTPSPAFIVQIVREAGDRGLAVTRSTRPTGLGTKFGTIETADVELSGAELARACIAFRHLEAELGFGLSGFWCGTAARPADRRQLTCLIDRLDLVSAAADPALRTLFSRAELARNPACAPPHLASAGRKQSWLDRDAAPPALKQRVSAIRPGPRAEPPALRR